MRICIVTRRDLFPTVHGAAVKIIRTAESLSRACNGAFIVTNDREIYHRYKDGRYEECRYPDWLVAATRMPPQFEAWLEKRGVPEYWHGIEQALFRIGYPPEEHFLYQPMVDPDFWLRTLYIGLRHRVRYFQAEFPGFAVPCVLAARATLGRSCIVQHNVEWQRLADTTELSPERIDRLRKVELMLLRLVDEVIAVSEVDRQQMVGEGIPRHKITVLPHGVDVMAFRRAAPAKLREEASVPPGVPLLFFHGTLHYEPNTVAVRMLSEEILPRFQREGPEVRVVAAGMHPPEQYAHPWMHYTGVIDDLPAAIAAADLCVVPLLAGGGTRLKILEYLAAGVPTVSTHKGAEGLRVEDGVEMALVADGNWDDFCGRVRQLIASPEAAQRMSARAADFALRYDWDPVCRAYVDLYRGKGRGEDRSGGIDDRESRQASKIRRRWRPGEGFSRPEAPAEDRAIDLEQALVDHLPQTPTWTKPRTAIVLLNRRCNLRCQFCDHWKYRDDLPARAIHAVIDQAQGVGVRTLVLTGGEPLLRRDLYDIIDRARDRELAVNVTTNGTLINRRIRKLAGHPPHSISVSIDGLDATHDRLRGREGTAAKAWAGIERLLADTDIAVNVYFVVTGENVHELAAVHERATALGAAFDFWPVNGHPELGIRDERGRAAYREAVTTVMEREPQRREHAAYYEYGREYLEGRRDRVRCLGLVEQFGVDHRGRLVPCCVWGIEDMAVGSVLEHSLEELLTSPRAREVRQQIFERGCLDRCFNHSLYEFGQATGLPFLVDGGDDG